MFNLALAVFIVLGISAMCSSTEAALFSVPLIEIKKLADKNNKSAIKLLSIRENTSRYITTIVILNNIANISGSMVVGKIATDLLGSKWLGLFSGILTFCVIIFSEIIPKTIGEQYSLKISLLALKPLVFITKLFTPLTIIIEKVLLPIMNKKNSKFGGESEIKLLTKIGYKEGHIEEDEAKMINRIFQMNDIIASEIMTPRVVMTYLKGSEKLVDVKDSIIHSQHNRIVIVKDNPDEVSGIALKIKLLEAIIEGKENEPISNFQIPAYFIPETKRIDLLLEKFLQKRNHIAIVVDEYGGVSGIITLEDVLEVITGEIIDETDRNVDLRKTAILRRKKVI